MMFKRRFLVTVLIVSLFSLLLVDKQQVQAEAKSIEVTSSKEVTSDTEIKEADILLVYGSNLSASEISSIEIIVKSITYLQRSIAYLPFSECEDIIDNYENIICYNIDLDGVGFIEKLADLDKNVFFLGGDGVVKYMNEIGYNLTATKIDDLAVSIKYDIEQQNFTSMVRLKNTYLLQGDFSYEAGTIQYGNKTIGLYSKYNTFWYTPFVDITNEILRASFANEAAKWLWPYNGQPHTYSQYIVLDEVYPFYPPEQLLEIIDYFIKDRLPFIISVMPIYENGDYPAMKRFCEVLTYAQANGGAIIMHAPNMLQQAQDKEQVWDYLTYATEAYTNFGVYPLGISVPESYLFQEASRQILQRYSTVFCYKSDEISAFHIEEGFNFIYKDGHNLIAPAYTMDQEGNTQILSISTAAYIDVSQGISSVKEQIDACVRSEVPLKSLWDLKQSVYANNLYLYTEKGELYFNHEKIALEYQPFTYEAYEYKSGVYQWIMKDLTGLNKQLAFIVVISSIIFIAFILAGRSRNRKRFILPREKEDKDGMG